MWLLDANLNIHLVELLRRFGIESDTAENRGWKALRNGDLIAVAAPAGFDVLLTQDQLFAESAARAWRSFPQLAIVIVALPQLPSSRYMESFTAAWNASSIPPRPGNIITWP